MPMDNNSIDVPNERLKRLMAKLESNVLPIGRREFSKEEYNLSFSDGTIKTPLGKVKLSENQFEKMNSNKRKGLLAAMRLTLSDPIIILHDIRYNEERQANEDYRIYIKPIRKLWDLKIKYMISIVADIDGTAISVSNGIREKNRIIKLIKTTKSILYEKQCSIILQHP